ncbi:MAG: carbohydrate ABC transporter permease [Bifidobacteriaceae bacterium]|jgi:ABC-type glycerol-3-phosphate transport system permease component|nr:carbohydrate ABC transporter permease [Bifidobacteriaceae bacterium]
MFEIRSRISRVILQVMITVLVLPFVVPLVVMVQVSFSGAGWGNYKAVTEVPFFLYFFRNSGLIALGVIAISYALTMMGAYGFSKLRIRGREFFFWMIMGALTLPEVVLIAPLFPTFSKLGLYDTFWAVIIPVSALQVPFTLLLTRTFVDGIPNDLLEAARIDGCGSIRTFWNVIIPLSRPMAAAIIVLVFINAWNAYLLPLAFLQNAEHEVVTQLPQYFRSQYSDDQTKQLAGAVLTALPEVIAYIGLQKFFERGMAAGAIK